MADKLDWLNRHLVLVRYLTVAEAVEQENYKIRPDLAELFAGVTGTQEMVYKFARVGRFKCASEFLAYISHRRAAVWWGYRCVLSLLEELAVNPAAERDIADIGARFETTVPDFAKVKPPEPDPAQIAALKAQVAGMEAEYQKARAAVDPEALALVDEAVGVVYQEFQRVHGIHPIELVKKLARAAASQSPHRADPASPLFAEAAKLKAQLAAVQKDTVDTIKAVIPPAAPAQERKVRAEALEAVHRWVVAPDDENSKKCLEAGNACADTPAGLLALTAFWSWGNLMPGAPQVVPTPPGLAPNGLCQVLLFCALAKGGTRKLKERYEHYFNLGVEVMTGADNWEEGLVKGTPPHAETAAAAREAPRPRSQTPYTRWKPV